MQPDECETEAYRAVCTCGADKVGGNREKIDEWIEAHWDEHLRSELENHTVEIRKVVDRVKP